MARFSSTFARTGGRGASCLQDVCTRRPRKLYGQTQPHRPSSAPSFALLLACVWALTLASAPAGCNLRLPTGRPSHVERVRGRSEPAPHSASSGSNERRPAPLGRQGLRGPPAAGRRQTAPPAVRRLGQQSSAQQAERGIPLLAQPKGWVPPPPMGYGPPLAPPAWKLTWGARFWGKAGEGNAV